MKNQTSPAAGLDQQIAAWDTEVLTDLLEETEVKIDRFYDAIDAGTPFEDTDFRAALKVRSAVEAEIAKRADAKARRLGLPV